MQSVATFFSQVMAAVGGNTAGPGVLLRLKIWSKSCTDESEWNLNFLLKCCLWYHVSFYICRGKFCQVSQLNSFACCRIQGMLSLMSTLTRRSDLHLWKCELLKKPATPWPWMGSYTRFELKPNWKIAIKPVPCNFLVEDLAVSSNITHAFLFGLLSFRYREALYFQSRLYLLIVHQVHL